LSEQTRGDFWTGFRTFECPTKILAYKGETPAAIALNLYMRAGCVSLKAKSDYRIRFPVRTDRLSKKIGKKRWSVGEGFKQLEKDHLIQRERRKTLIHRFATTRVTILNPHDGTPLLASPDRLDVLTANKITDFLTIPLDCLRAFNQLPSAAPRAVYVAAHFLATRFKSDRFTVSKSYWRRVSKLGRHSFERGLRILKRRKLLKYSDAETLTLTDPLTGKRPQRPPLPLPMPIDFDTITAHGWEKVCCDLLGGTFDVRSDNGWTRTTKDRVCPFCGSYRCFALNFEQVCFRCFNCHEKGKLGVLAMKVLSVDRMYDAAAYIKKTLETTTPVVTV